MNAIRPWLFIGNHRDAFNRRLLELNSIHALLHLAEKVDPPGIDTLYLPLEDMASIPADMIESGIDFIKKHVDQNHNILIICGAGINRSIAYCIIALKEVEGLGLLDAYKAVKERHYDALPNRRVWESLCDYYKEPVLYANLMKATMKPTSQFNKNAPAI